MEPTVELVQDPSPGAIVVADSTLVPAEEPSERRREPRYPTDRLTLVHILGRTLAEPILCRILDYSGTGLRIRTQKPIPPGTGIRVSLRESFAIAKVCYCNPAEGGFDHGILVEEVRTAAAVNP